jgi:hypothetical protein
MNPSLRIDGTTLTYMQASGEFGWTLPIDVIVLIAEYTTNEGPYLDDYFLTFITVEDGKAFYSSCSFYAEGRDDVFLELSARLGSTIEMGLAASTEWKSRIMWPSSMEGLEYFTFKSIPPKNLFQKLRQKIFGSELEYGVSETVRNYVRAQIRT